ncbi:MAG: DegV family protein [Coriobacteriales bacterium]|nr:DegV family protein [Actinomycetes bacterium]
MSVRVVTDSTANIPSEERERRGITVIPLSIALEGTMYVEGDADDAFYKALETSKTFPSSSQPSVAAFADVFMEAAEAGDEVTGVFISSRMSGTYSTALMARDLVHETHPDARIEIVDSGSNCMEEGFAVFAATEAAAAGASASEAAQAAVEMTAHTRFLFVPETLEYLRRGGRIGSASALLGTLLQIRPVLTVVDGETDVFARVRTRKKAVAEIIAAFEKDIAQKGLGGACVHHIADVAAGQALAEMVEAAIGEAVPVVGIGPVVGGHVGPGTVGVVYHTIGVMDKRHSGKASA